MGSGYIGPRSLDQALSGGEWSGLRPCLFTPGGRSPRYPLEGGWVDPRAGVNDVEWGKFLTLPGLEIRTLAHLANSQSLYRLRYPATCIVFKM
jgi:hypothetical protein